MPPLRDKQPSRTSESSYSNYQKAKKQLRNDFFSRCGYCNDPDYYCGGKRGYHLDHFRPKSLFPGLQNIYSNLVYACPYCNGSKSNDWPAGDSLASVRNGKGYVDPCDPNFIIHLYRTDDGKIKAVTEIGNYMYQHLKLGLYRHQIIWLKEQVEQLLKKVIKILGIHGENDSNTIKKLREKHIQLTNEYFKLKDTIKETQ